MEVRLEDFNEGNQFALKKSLLKLRLWQVLYKKADAKVVKSLLFSIDCCLTNLTLYKCT